jgi:hypothetical protein
MQPPWQIQVGRKSVILAEFLVPAHRLQKNSVTAFLKALLVRFSATTAEDMAQFYVNKRPGSPSRLSWAEVRHWQDVERGRVGYWCGTWECYASAMRALFGVRHDRASNLAPLPSIFPDQLAPATSEADLIGGLSHAH